MIAVSLVYSPECKWLLVFVAGNDRQVKVAVLWLWLWLWGRVAGINGHDVPECLQQ